jgi:hypothetical protein
VPPKLETLPSRSHLDFEGRFLSAFCGAKDECINVSVKTKASKASNQQQSRATPTNILLLGILVCHSCLEVLRVAASSLS